jgi:hypothetical protein
LVVVAVAAASSDHMAQIISGSEHLWLLKVHRG